MRESVVPELLLWSLPPSPLGGVPCYWGVCSKVCRCLQASSGEQQVRAATKLSHHLKGKAQPDAITNVTVSGLCCISAPGNNPGNAAGSTKP